MKKHLSLLILAVITVSLFTGCGGNASSDSDVKPSPTPQPGKGLVLFYFKSGMLGGANTWQIYANEQLVAKKFGRGDCFAYQADPGQLNLWIKCNMGFGNLIPLPGNFRTDQAPLQILPNQTYYEEMYLGGAGAKLRQVSQEEGKKGIEDCDWMDQPSSTSAQTR